MPMWRLFEQRLDSRISCNSAVQIEAALEPVAQCVVALQHRQGAGAGSPIKSAECYVIGEIGRNANTILSFPFHDLNVHGRINPGYGHGHVVVERFSDCALEIKGQRLVARSRGLGLEFVHRARDGRVGDSRR
jgi:hypothetical protein